LFLVNYNLDKQGTLAKKQQRQQNWLKFANHNPKTYRYEPVEMNLSSEVVI